MQYTIDSRKKLNDSNEIPRLGLGVFQAEDGAQVKQSILWALEAGYRLIDTAAMYKNEKGVGEAIRESGIPREDIFVTTKMWNTDVRQGTFQDAIDKSLELLQMDYVDLYLIHWPVENRNQAWDFLCEQKAKGICKSIGVSNFVIPQLDELLEHSNIVPAVNQIEFHPYLQSPGLRVYCRDKGIALQAWSPIMRGMALKDPALLEIAAKHSKTPAQVILRWDLQSDVLTIPKSVRKERIQENSTLYDFELSDEDMRQITKLNQNMRNGPDPLNFNF